MHKAYFSSFLVFYTNLFIVPITQGITIYFINDFSKSYGPLVSYSLPPSFFNKATMYLQKKYIEKKNQE